MKAYKKALIKEMSCSSIFSEVSIEKWLDEVEYFKTKYFMWFSTAYNYDVNSLIMLYKEKHITRLFQRCGRNYKTK